MRVCMQSFFINSTSTIVPLVKHLSSIFFFLPIRDVSLENLLLEGNVVKIIDLGLALKVPQFADGSAVPLPPQGACGKQFYMSPEVLTSSGEFDGFAVDVWACGIMLFV